MRHLLKHIKFWWYQRRYNMPRWCEDKVAQMFGVSQYGCPSCGYGALEELDRKEAS